MRDPLFLHPLYPIPRLDFGFFEIIHGVSNVLVSDGAKSLMLRELLFAENRQCTVVESMSDARLKWPAISHQNCGRKRIGDFAGRISVDAIAALAIEIIAQIDGAE